MGERGRTVPSRDPPGNGFEYTEEIMDIIFPSLFWKKRKSHLSKGSSHVLPSVKRDLRSFKLGQRHAAPIFPGSRICMQRCSEGNDCLIL